MLNIAPCYICGKHCYEIELSDEGAGWRKNGVPCHYEEWEDTFRLWRMCDESDDDSLQKDDNRTEWTASMKDAIRQWNEMQEGVYRYDPWGYYREALHRFE